MSELQLSAINAEDWVLRSTSSLLLSFGMSFLFKFYFFSDWFTLPSVGQKYVLLFLTLLTCDWGGRQRRFKFPDYMSLTPLAWSSSLWTAWPILESYITWSPTSIGIWLLTYCCKIHPDVCLLSGTLITHDAALRCWRNKNGCKSTMQIAAKYFQSIATISN